MQTVIARDYIQQFDFVDLVLSLWYSVGLHFFKPMGVDTDQRPTELEISFPLALKRQNKKKTILKNECLNPKCVYTYEWNNNLQVVLNKFVNYEYILLI